MTTKVKAKKANGRTGRPAQEVKIDAKALTLAKKLNKEYGPCTVVREVTQTFKKLKRGEVIAVMKAVGISPATASKQYQEVRSGNIHVTV